MKPRTLVLLLTALWLALPARAADLPAPLAAGLTHRRPLFLPQLSDAAVEISRPIAPG